MSWVIGPSLLTICTWIAVALFTGDGVATLFSVTSSIYGVLLLLILFPILLPLLLVRPDLLVGLLGFAFLSFSILATIAILLSDASVITAGVPLIVVVSLGGIMIDRSLRQAAAA
ncbi:MAG TPA: hypothetical protein VFH75_00185 [Actinomycetota bacterium]|nr:hypothetical protein [Actinomycetota bacterium]